MTRIGADMRDTNRDTSEPTKQLIRMRQAVSMMCDTLHDSEFHAQQTREQRLSAIRSLARCQRELRAVQDDMEAREQRGAI